MKRVKAFFLASIIALSFTSCYTIEHTIGAGAQGSNSTKQAQWFALWGLVPISDVNTKAMAAGATDYNIKNEQTFVDGLISIFTGIVTISKRTIEVKK